MTGEKSENPLHHNETHCQNDSEGRQKCYYVPDDVHNNKAKVFMRKDRGKLSMLQQRGQFLRIISLKGYQIASFLCPVGGCVKSNFLAYPPCCFYCRKTILSCPFLKKMQVPFPTALKFFATRFLRFGLRFPLLALVSTTCPHPVVGNIYCLMLNLS